MKPPRRGLRAAIVGALCLVSLAGLLLVLLAPQPHRVVPGPTTTVSTQTLITVPGPAPIVRDTFVAEPTPRVGQPEHPPFAVRSSTSPSGRSPRTPSSRPHSSGKPGPTVTRTTAPASTPAPTRSPSPRPVCVLILCIGAQL